MSAEKLVEYFSELEDVLCTGKVAHRLTGSSTFSSSLYVPSLQVLKAG